MSCFTWLVTGDFTAGQVSQVDILMSGSYNNTLHIISNLNISHTLGMIDLLNTTDRAVFTKAHQLMFETVRIYNHSEITITSVMILAHGVTNIISQSPDGRWYVAMRNSSNPQCLVSHLADVSETGAYFARVDYNDGIPQNRGALVTECMPFQLQKCTVTHISTVLTIWPLEQTQPALMGVRLRMQF